MIDKVVASQNLSAEVEEKVRASYLKESVRGNDDSKMGEFFKQFVESDSLEAKRMAARNMFIQSIEDSKEIGDSYDIEKHYSTPQIALGRYENIFCKLTSAR